MKITRKSIERSFETWGRLSFRYRWIIAAAALAIAAGLIWQLQYITIDTSSEGFLRENDPVLITYNDFRDQFGRDIPIMLAIEPPEVFDTSFLEKLRDLHTALEAEVPKVEKVTSLINIRETRGVGDQLVVKDLLEEFPANAEEMADLRRRVLANPLYRDSIISTDGRITAVLIESDAYSSLGLSEASLDEFGEEDAGDAAEGEKRPYLTGEENTEMVLAVLEIVERFDAPDFPIRRTGSPIIGDRLQAYLGHDMKLFLGMAMIAISVFLFILFRRIAAVILPVVVIMLSLLSTLGMMASFGVPIQVPTQILPSFLASVGVGYTVHLLVVFFQHFDDHGDKQSALAYALGHSGVAIAMTAATTVAGLLSFSTSDLLPIAMFGVFAAIGVGMALLYTLTLLPALLAIVPMRPRTRKLKGPGLRAIDSLLSGCGRLATSHPWKVVAVGIAIALIAAVGAAQIRFSHFPIGWFPEEDPIRTHTEYIDEALGGTGTIEVVIDTGRENGLHDPEVLRRVDTLNQRIEEFKRAGERFGRSISILEILKETHQALNENDPASYVIPDDRALIAQELLLFENSGSDDLEDFVDSQFSLARFTLRTYRTDAFESIGIVQEMESEFKRILGDRAEVRVTGLLLLMTETMKAVILSMTKSYGLAFLLITPMMMLLIGSVRGGLISMVPNLTPILLTLGMMGWFDFPIDIFTLLIGCIAVGLAVDDTIHFIHGFQRYYRESRDAPDAVQRTMHSTGRALLFTSLVLSTGFFIFMMSSMSNLFAFGFLTGFAIVTAFICDVLLTPALLTLATRMKRPWKLGAP